MALLSIQDAVEMPRSRRSGLEIQPELMEAVENGHATGRPFRVECDEQDADNVGKMLRSLRSRHGYVMETTRQKKDERVQFFVQVTGRREQPNGSSGGDGGDQGADSGAEMDAQVPEPPAAAEPPTPAKTTTRRKR